MICNIFSSKNLYTFYLLVACLYNSVFFQLTNSCKLLLMGNNFSTPNQEGLELSIEAYVQFTVCMMINFVCTNTHISLIHNYANSTAQSGGGSFKNRKPIGELVIVSHGWQSEDTDGPTNG